MYICVHVYIRVCVCNIHVCVHPYFSETGPLSELGVNWFVEGLDTDHRGSSQHPCGAGVIDLCCQAWLM